MRRQDFQITSKTASAEKTPVAEASINLKKLGEPVNSRMEAIRRFSDGDQIFAFHDMGEAPMEITDLAELENFTPDQLLAVSRHAISDPRKPKEVVEFVDVDAIHAEALREYLQSNPELLKNRQDFFVESLKSDQEVIDHVRSALIPEMRKYQVPVTPENHFARLSSAVFEGVSASLASGKRILEKFKSLDQRGNLKISVGSMVSILNLRMSQDFVELFGFRTPKKITRIYREPTENKIVQLEFNNDPEDVWPRKPLASYNGELVMTSAFFPSARDLDQAVSVLQLSTPSEFTIRTNILEFNQESAWNHYRETNKEQGVAEGSRPWKGLGFSVRSDLLWPAKMFESANPGESESFSRWLSDYSESLDTPAPGKKCLLVMVNRTSDTIMVFYGVARYAGETASHYQLEIDSGTHGYSRNNQLVFADRQAFDHFKTLLSTKFGDTKIEFQQMPVMETQEGIAEGQLAELSKDTLKSYFPKRHASAKALSRTDYDKARRIADTDLPRALRKLKDHEYGKQGMAEGKEETLEKKIQAKQDALSLAREQRRGRGHKQQGSREIKLQAEIDKLNTELSGIRSSTNKNPVQEGLSWSSLDQGLSLEDKLVIFEEYSVKGTLTESNDPEMQEYFQSLFDMSDTPVKNQKYVVVPLMLVKNRIMKLDTPSILKYLGTGRDGLVFRSATGQKTYPAKQIRSLSVVNTFTFENSQKYDEFRTILSLKFNTELPKMKLSEIKKSVAETSYAKDLDEKKPVKVSGVKGMKSTPFTKKFRNLEAYRNWSESDESGNYEVHQVTNEGTGENVKEGYWADAVKAAEKSRAERAGKPFEKNPASHDEQGIYKGDRDLAGNPVPKRKQQGMAEGYTGRETKDGTWRVFKDGQPVAVAGPFNSREEANNWINAQKQSVEEAFLDPSGLQAAAAMVKNFIVTAEVDGKVKKFRVRGMTGARSAQERFLKHHSMARILDVKPEKDVTEASTARSIDYAVWSQKLQKIRKKLMQKYPNLKILNKPRDQSKSATQSKKLTLDVVWRKVEQVVANVYPDGDPIDWMTPWLEKHGIRDFKVGEVLDRAARKHGYKDLYDYYNSMGDLYGKQQGMAEGLKNDNIALLKRGEKTSDGIGMQELKNYIRTKERVLAGGNALSPGERKALAQARQELKQLKKKGVEEASFTAATAMHAATRKRDKQLHNPQHNIRVGDQVTTQDGKTGKAVFVDGETVHVKGVNPYYPDKVTQYKGSELKKDVAENIWDNDDEDENPSELHSGGYVRDKQEGERGEVFIMRGNPEERRVRIEDKNGSGWNISPSRLIPVSDDDPAIARYFGSSN
jgi:hypothetical protein